MNPSRIVAALCLFLSGIGLSRAAGEPSQSLPQSTPEAEGVSSSAILGFVDAAEQRIDALHSFVLVRHGRVVAEGWWAPYSAEEPHELYSLSKSFTSTAVGLAIAEGKLSLSDPILKFFPGSAPAEPDKNLSSMRVRDLLRMSTGQVKEDIGTFAFNSRDDLTKAFLAMPVPYKPGTHFVYNTEATYMLSAIVQKVTGQTVLDYLGPRIFEPLGIARPTWDASAQGVSFGGFGLSIRTEDIARFGELYLQKGQWQGRQLVPASWVEAATSLQTSNGSDPESDWDQGYGYQFWRCRHGFFRGDGAYGQLCIVMPEYDAVIAVTAGTGDMQGELNLVWDKIIPAFSASALPADPDSDRRLAETPAGLQAETAAWGIEPFLGRLVVIGRDHQDGIGAGLLGVLGEFDRLPGRIGAGAGHDRNPAARLIDAPLHHLFVLVMGQCRAFAGGAHRDKPAGALGDLPVHEIAKRFFVDGTVLERGDKRGKRASEACLGGHDTIHKSINGAAIGPPWPTRRASVKRPRRSA